VSRRLAAVVLLLAVAGRAGAAAESAPTIPPPRGYVTDTAGVLGPGVTARLTALATELQAKTGAEIAVLTVQTTAPLDQSFAGSDGYAVVLSLSLGTFQAGIAAPPLGAPRPRGCALGGCDLQRISSTRPSSIR